MEGVSEYVRSRPAPLLRPYVAWYSGYREAGMAPARHRGLPSPYLTFIITLDEPLTVAAHPDPATAPGQYDTLIGGLHTTPAIITHEGRQSGLQLALTPLGARALLGLPAGELASADLHAAEVLGPFADQLRERMWLASDWTERFTLLDGLLLGRVRPDATMRTEVARAWHRLLATGGTLPVAELAEEIGWSSRHLGEVFRSEIGLGLKEAGRMVRFDRARKLVAAGPRLAEVAAECGYFDQAHLDREFRAFAGCSPSRWLAEEFRNIQALDPWIGEESTV